MKSLATGLTYIQVKLSTFGDKRTEIVQDKDS